MAGDGRHNVEDLGRILTTDDMLAPSTVTTTVHMLRGCMSGSLSMWPDRFNGHPLSQAFSLLGTFSCVPRMAQAVRRLLAAMTVSYSLQIRKNVRLDQSYVRALAYVVRLARPPVYPGAYIIRVSVHRAALSSAILPAHSDRPGCHSHISHSRFPRGAP